MANHSPMDVLRNLAEQTLDEATRSLGQSRQAHQDALRQHNELLGYEREYRQQLQNCAVTKSVPVQHLLNYSAFIRSLEEAAKQHQGHVRACEQAVSRSLATWRNDKKRFNAFTTLKERADAVTALKQTRQEQKMMDEFAQRASMKKEGL
ncbi:MAG: flagellar export protein FliJ [Pantoea sp.]|uniref:Flagellar FliJ protein n=1 Tax=Pantoea septica TaxID=472695 RepID=A0ABX3UVU7_9GAMM|nr:MULTISPECIES: flagellar export protein FliJ [Pantoea]MDU5781169.1 flagellar export protein FliJ [Pantoea sp.]ORN02602.1 flagellar export protein FliJ [Pantoea septica]